jgi:hypothetical protein
VELIDLLYQAISEYGEKRILSDIAQGESSTTISTIFEYCMSNLEKAGGSNSEIRGGLAEGLMHYLLTVSLIPSQRKTELQSIDIDVAIPDTKTLASSPEDVIIISFLKTKEPSVIKQQVDKLKKIQPKSENIWMVVDEPLSVEAKLYTLDGSGFTFSNIVNDLISFTSNAKQSKLKIFRI